MRQDSVVLCTNHHRQLRYVAVEWPEGPKRPPAVVINGDRYPIRWSWRCSRLYRFRRRRLRDAIFRREGAGIRRACNRST